MRLLLLLSVLLLEILGFSLWLDTATIGGASGLTGWIAHFGAAAVRGAVGFCLVFGILAGARLRTAAEVRAGRIRWPFVLAHAIALTAAAILSPRVFDGTAGDAGAALWICLGFNSVLMAALACYTAGVWIALATRVWDSAALSLAASLVAVWGGPLLWRLWDSAAVITLAIVSVLLRPLVADIQADAVTKLLSSSRFEIIIAPQCSGYEGMGLVLAFGSLWLWLYRREYRFPRALLILPAGLVSIFILNSFRIAGLFLLGHIGATGIALGGFHSQAGWIAFLLVSISLAAYSRRVAWISSVAAGPGPAAFSNPSTADATTAALVPFLAIVGASILAGAFTAGFEWLYPLRFIAAVAALWIWRDEYRKLNWTLSWRPVLSGITVLGVWLGMEALMPAPALHQPTPPLWWLAIRILAASITVPVAEELAFRHFGLRRLASADFEQMSPNRVPLWALLVSSLLFGVLHGSRWLAGTIAGLVFGLDYRRRGSIGDAVLSHGVANALLSAYVLATGNWQLW